MNFLEKCMSCLVHGLNLPWLKKLIEVIVVQDCPTCSLATQFFFSDDL